MGDVDWIDLAQEEVIGGLLWRRYLTLGIHKVRENIDLVRNYQLLKNDSAVWNYSSPSSKWFFLTSLPTSSLYIYMYIYYNIT